MRKNLLGSAAVLGGLLFTGGAYAQSVTSPALLAGASAPSGSSEFPSPGTVTVRFGGNFDWFAAATSDSADRSTRFGPGGTGTSAPSKEASHSFGDYLRLYPTVDGVAANGLRYGVYSELRVENGINTGGGANASISATDRSSSLYVRRAYGYLGLANYGYIRAGTSDGAGGLFDTGTFQNFDPGGAWNGDIPNLINGNAQVVFPFEGGVGAFYATDKITYLSPQVYGLEFGLSYEPNTSNITDYNSGNSSSNSLRLDSSSNPADLKRRRNWVNPEFRYRQTFGPVGVALQAGWNKSGAVSYDGVVGSTTQQYKGFDFGNYGIVLTYGGLSVGGHVMEGAFNGQGGLAPQGTKNAFAYIAGLSYTVGPVIVGASFFQYNFAGNSNSTALSTRGSATLSPIGEERDRGIAAGGTYTITPGVSLFVSYVYGDKKENGYDLINGAQSVRGSNQGNTTRAQALGSGFNIRW